MKARYCSFHHQFFSCLIVPMLLLLVWSVCAWGGTGGLADSPTNLVQQPTLALSPAGTSVQFDISRFLAGRGNRAGSLVAMLGTGRVFLDGFETCEGGCDDANACTADFCTSAGCIFDAEAANGRLCDDDDLCTVEDACTGGTCMSGTPLDCDDQNMCTLDSCNGEFGCISDEQGAEGIPCDDGDVCTVGEICTAGYCGIGTPLDCDDQNMCTLDSCNGEFGCINDEQGAEGIPCDDGDPGTIGETCQKGTCTAPDGSCDFCCADFGQCNFNAYCSSMPCTYDICPAQQCDNP